jgi:hypothetical protein
MSALLNLVSKSSSKGYAKCQIFSCNILIYGWQKVENRCVMCVVFFCYLSQNPRSSSLPPPHHSSSTSASCPHVCNRPNGISGATNSHCNLPHHVQQQQQQPQFNHQQNIPQRSEFNFGLKSSVGPEGRGRLLKGAPPLP